MTLIQSPAHIEGRNPAVTLTTLFPLRSGPSILRQREDLADA